MKKYIVPTCFILIFLIGLTFFLYPFISNFNNDYINNQLIDKYDDLENELSYEEKNQLLEDARTYNANLFNKQKLEELGLEYENMLNPNGDSMMGTLEIPKIRVNLPIFHTLDYGNLQAGIGHKEDSALPVGGIGTHCVLAGHTGLPSAKLLTSLDRLQNDDLFYIHVLGETLTYRVNNIAIVEPDETSLLQAKSDKDYLTIVTCTPYGINTHRLLVRGERVEEGEEIEVNAISVQNDIEFIKPVYIITICIVTAVVLYFGVKCIASKIIRHKRKGGDASDNNTIP
ncbi:MULTISPECIES: class C sortase [unclassified Ruminococcus]|uniref:class C sortase n=1 Tax=unclassified Ruminococcus TaxID=2608920 RepID=UPI00210DA1B2|nr:MULTISPECIES: class C sortase [unclassified Ruminococcus]MCQ4023324.1 class C sortase [Ruminococcus sp. zg-924]MCQ4115691.1 class C sortase [Ruminococcus sp. zg-921]